MKKFLGVLFILVLVFSLAAIGLQSPVLAQSPEVWVDNDWAGSNPGDPVDGHIFGTDAFATIQDGIDAVASPGMVHVAGGTYYENITLKDGLKLQGAGADVTTIDGDRKGGVVFMAHNSILRGFRVTGGGLDWQIYIFRCAIQSVGKVNVEIAENTIEDNWSPLGASGSDLLFHHNLVVNNSGTVELHGVSSALIVNNIFANNGFALELKTSSAFIINNTIVKNGNGIVLLSGSSPDIRNNIVAGNTYVGINNVPEPLDLPTLHHNNVWNNGTDYQNLSPGSGDISADPMFADPAGGNYHLQAGSPCIDAGDSTAVPDWLTTDFEGDPRIVSDVVDMGADEYYVVPATVDIDPDTLNLKSKAEWVTAYIELPTGWDVADIDLSTVILTVILNGVVPAVSDPQYGFVTNPDSYIMDNDGDGALERMVKFDRAAVKQLVNVEEDLEEDSGGLQVEIQFAVSGEVAGIGFEGKSTVLVLYKGK